MGINPVVLWLKQVLHNDIVDLTEYLLDRTSWVSNARLVHLIDSLKTINGVMEAGIVTCIVKRHVLVSLHL